MPERAFGIVVAFSLLLSACAETKPGSDSDPDSVFRPQEGEHEVHGEVGVMYGHTMR
jgi:hypothetical protein